MTVNSMKCTDCEEKLSDYLDHVLGADDRSAVEWHCKSCSSCRELLAGMTQLLEVAPAFPVYEPPPWLVTRIIANTPQRRQGSLRTVLADVWRSLGEPRTALAIFTAAVVIGWLGGVTVREAVVDRAEGVLSCAYDHAVRTYYRSPVIIEIHSEIQSRLDQLWENS